MKHLLFPLFTLLILNSHAQQTYVPDDNFEARLEAIGMGNGIPNDDSVTTANISSVLDLYLVGTGITDLTGIEDFTSLRQLNCNSNSLTSLDLSQNTTIKILWFDNNLVSSLDLSQNTILERLYCSNNPLVTLDISQNTALKIVWCSNSQLTALDLSQNTALEYLICDNNALTALDVSQNLDLYSIKCQSNLLTTIDLSLNDQFQHLNIDDNLVASLDLSEISSLKVLRCANNQLTSLDVSQNNLLYILSCEINPLQCLNVRNGNNWNVNEFNADQCPQLTCIEVDDALWATANWTNIDAQTSFSVDCGNACSVPLGIEEIESVSKQLIKIVDIMGRQTFDLPNMLLFRVYSDGSIEKTFRIE